MIYFFVCGRVEGLRGCVEKAGGGERVKIVCASLIVQSTYCYWSQHKITSEERQ